jgi:diguanylate cyclase (GGDEF)-like protein
MAASDQQTPDPPPRQTRDCLTAEALDARLQEEINRAGRHASALGCLFVEIEDLQAIEQAHGAALSEQALAYVGLALCREFRRFDRVGRTGDGEFVVVLPGADAARGEIVARRTLARLHAIKIEVRGERRALRVAVGIAAWRDGLSAAQLLAAAREAAGREPADCPGNGAAGFSAGAVH